ncbi:MAG: diguanylate cyclase response regulator [Deltaproteobacteria bacterium]|nr:diguanylate cyclase response regulator [Deltaproteobacteria bacterium]
MSILLLENDEDDQFLLVESLNSLPDLQVNVTWTKTLAEANLAISSQHFDLVFVDLHLDGEETGHQFLREHEHLGVPLVMLTGHGNPVDDRWAMELGADDFLDKNDYTPRHIGRVIQHALARSNRLRKLQLASEHDVLTGLCNRRALKSWFEGASARTRRKGGCLAAIAVDLDQFKPINDEHGHAAGDAVLCAVAERLLQTVRSSDMVARVGGDEFLLLLEDATDTQMLELICRRAKENIERPILWGDSSISSEFSSELTPTTQGYYLHIKASLGAATLAEGESLDALLERADQIMYQEKMRARTSSARGG